MYFFGAFFREKMTDFLVFIRKGFLMLMLANDYLTINQKIDYLKSLGVSLSSSANLTLNQKLFPKLSFDGSYVILHYPSPNHNEFGQQQFYFKPALFLQAFDQKKYQKFTPKAEYKNFDQVFFQEFYPNANPYVKLIFQTFSITPTALNKTYSMNKKIRRKTVLMPKQKYILKNVFLVELNCPSCSQDTTPSANDNSNQSIDCLKRNDSIVNDSIIRLNQQLNNYVTLAAKNFDLQSYFYLYLKTYKILLNKKDPKKFPPHLLDKIYSLDNQNSKSFKNLQAFFNQEVDKVQKNML
jgi:hypothetical protein